MPKFDLHRAQDADADALLSRDPLALLTGMLLDQQMGPHGKRHERASGAVRPYL
jgi:hypothetical protein